MKYFIGLDIGTSSVKAMLLNEREIVKIASRDYPVFYPKNGWWNRIRRTGTGRLFPP